MKNILDGFVSVWQESDDQTAWFDKIKAVGEQNGYCPNMKEYKKDPTGWKGSVGDVSAFLRVAVTGKTVSPDLYTVMNILGAEKVIARINSFKETL